VLKAWFLAIRPWSFTASLVPISLGTAIAFDQGAFQLHLFLLTALAGVLAHAGTNMINTYGDFIIGVDTVASAEDRSPLVTGRLHPSQMKAGGIASLAAAACLGLLLTYLYGWPIAVIGALGITGGYCYTAGWKPYKYLGLGSPLVFLLMGPLMVWPAYFIQTGTFSWLPVWISFPIGFLVSAILHSNDLRDHPEDRRAGIQTFSLLLGFENSVVLFYLLYTAAFICLIVLSWLGLLPWTALLPLVLLPVIIKIFRQANEGSQGSQEKLNGLEAAAAGIHCQFGLLLVFGLILYPFFQRWHC
jgi:1,4-dihydroxy-2-naphthoate octaprenyltransferase